MTSKTERFIVAAQLTTEEIPYHDMRRAREMLGPNYSYMSSSVVPEADMSFSVQHVDKVPPDFKSYVEPHKHPASQLFAIIGDLTLEVILDGERSEVSGPAALFVPAGMSHTMRPLRGSGYIAVATRAGKFETTAGS